MILVVAAEQVPAIQAHLAARDEKSYIIGRVVAGEGQVELK